MRECRKGGAQHGRVLEQTSSKQRPVAIAAQAGGNRVCVMGGQAGEAEGRQTGERVLHAGRKARRETRKRAGQIGTTVGIKR